jgi:hypothetical protein
MEAFEAAKRDVEEARKQHAQVFLDFEEFNSRNCVPDFFQGTDLEYIHYTIKEVSKRRTILDTMENRLLALEWLLCFPRMIAASLSTPSAPPASMSASPASDKDCLITSTDIPSNESDSEIRQRK